MYRMQVQLYARKNKNIANPVSTLIEHTFTISQLHKLRPYSTLSTLIADLSLYDRGITNKKLS